MLFKKYHIVIFRESDGASRQVRIRGSLVIILLFLLFVFAGSTAYLWNFRNSSIYFQEQMRESTKTIQEQNSQIASMAGKLQGLQADIARVQTFDTKLRVMMNLSANPLDMQSADNAPSANGAQPLPLHRQELLARRVHNLLDQLATDSRMEEFEQQELLHVLRANRDLLSSTPSIWPVEGFLSSSFGTRASPFGRGGDFHKGLDIANSPGTPVCAPAKGIVASAGWDGAYGNCIIINHGNNLSTRYAHLQDIRIKVNQAVNRGDVIASLGSTGRSTGPHLHYEVRIGGVCVNPMRYILN